MISVSIHISYKEESKIRRRVTEFAGYCTEVGLKVARSFSMLYATFSLLHLWICDFLSHHRKYTTNKQRAAIFTTIIEHHSKAHKIKFQKLKKQYKNYTQIYIYIPTGYTAQIHRLQLYTLPLGRQRVYICLSVIHPTSK